MAAAEATGVTFVDEDDPPVDFLRVSHVDSDKEAPSDFKYKIERSLPSNSAPFACTLSTTTILQALLILIKTNCRKSGRF